MARINESPAYLHYPDARNRDPAFSIIYALSNLSLVFVASINSCYACCIYYYVFNVYLFIKKIFYLHFPLVSISF